MPINFPNSPSPSQLYSYDDKTWEWNGTYWEVYSALTSYVTGSGTTNYIPKWTGTTNVGNSQIYDDGSIVYIGGSQVLGSYFSVTGTVGINEFQIQATSGSLGITDTDLSAWTTGSGEIAIGNGGPLASSTGADNVAIGNQSMSNNTSGVDNVAVGKRTLVANQAGQGNVAIGKDAGADVTSGSYNVFIGYQAGGGITTEDNRLYIANSVGTPLIYGEFDNGIVNINGTLSAATYDNLPLYSAGLLTNSDQWINNNDGTVTLPSAYAALYNQTTYPSVVEVFLISSGTSGTQFPALSNNDTNYVVIDYSGGTPSWNILTDNSTINGETIVLTHIIYRAGNFLHVLDFGNEGFALPNKINDRIVAVNRFGRESGFSLGLSGSGVVTLTSGVAWNGTNRQSLVPVNSQDDIFFQVYHTGGTWTYTTSANTLNNLYYDNGTNPVLATGGKYLVNWYFRGQEINDHLYEVWGVDEYDSVSEAQLSTEPNLPELITSHAFLTGRIIVQVSATTGTVESAFVQVFQPSTVQAHNDLTSIQGGQAGEYYHLTSSQYNNLSSFKNIQVDGVTQFSSTSLTDNLNFSGINITITSAATNTLVFSAGTGGGGGVTQIVAGTNITISPTGGTGVVTINSTASGGTSSVNLGTVYTTSNNFNFL